MRHMLWLSVAGGYVTAARAEVGIWGLRSFCQDQKITSRLNDYRNKLLQGLLNNQPQVEITL